MPDLTVTHSESLKLNGSQQGSSNVFTIEDITQLYKNIVTVPANADTYLMATHSSVADAKTGTDITAPLLDIDLVKYIRITNLSGTPLNLSLQIDPGEDDTAANHSTTILLAGGQSFVMGVPHDGIATSDANANVIADLVDLRSIIADSLAAAVQCEVFIASINA
tara:strand:- start:226 stop:720 length:495 start_codon:yes stop_codon:yes gene_type:complete